MARYRRKTRTLDDLYAIAAALPWWAGIALALISFTGFHLVATMAVIPAASVRGVNEIGNIVGAQMLKTFSTFLQYIVPAIFCFGAIGSWFGRHKRRNLLTRIHANRALLSTLSWQEFEQLVGEAFRQRGYSVEGRPSFVKFGPNRL